MVTVLIFIIVGIIVGTLIYFNTWDSNIGVIIPTTALSLLIGCGVACENGEPIKYERVVEKQKLLAIQDANSMSGKFFIASGSINNQDYYKCYVEVRHGEYMFKKFNAEWCTIKFTDKTPMIVRKKWKPLGRESEITTWKIITRAEDKTKNTYWSNPVIYIPKGGILREYNLDLK